MIYRRTDASTQTSWSHDSDSEAARVAIRFIDGERQLLELKQMEPALRRTLTDFLEHAGHVEVARGVHGELLVQSSQSWDGLIVTGKTAEVLRAYIDHQPVSSHDRADMTIRRRSQKS